MTVENIVYAAIFIIIGAIGSYIVQKLFLYVKSRLHERAPIIKRYWHFVIPFSMLTTLAYVLVYFFSNNEISFGLVGQISTLVLAIFAGYIAFSEFGESKYHRLLEEGMSASSNRAPKTALTKYKEAHSLKPNEPLVLGNLLEILLMLKMYDEFDIKIERYKKIIIEKSDELIYMYLLGLRYLVREHNGEAKEPIADAVKFIIENPDTRDLFNWSNDPLINSEIFQKLGVSSQKIIINYFAFLQNSLNSAEEKLFIQGSYEMDTDQTRLILQPTQPVPQSV